MKTGFLLLFTRNFSVSLNSGGAGCPISRDRSFIPDTINDSWELDLCWLEWK